jgi:hypothetical protein
MFNNGLPCLTCSACLIKRSAPRSKYLATNELVWGVTMTLGWVNRGWPWGRGSGSVTSKTTPERPPSRLRASRRSPDRDQQVISSTGPGNSARRQNELGDRPAGMVQSSLDLTRSPRPTFTNTASAGRRAT